MSISASIPLIILRDLAAWDALIRSTIARDGAALARLHADGAATTIAAGTPLRIDEDLATLVRVTVLDGPSSGLRGLTTWQGLQAQREAA